MADTPQFSEIAYACQNLSPTEFVWLLGWNIAAGRWGWIGLDERAGRGLLLDLFGKLHGGLEVVEESSGRLQQQLMSLRRASFEEIQQEAPFSRHAQHNMGALLRAWREPGEAGFARAWEGAFPAGGETARERQVPSGSSARSAIARSGRWK